MASGYRGTILRVDLSNQKVEVEENGTFYRTYLGGRGIGYHSLLTEETKGC